MSHAASSTPAPSATVKIPYLTCAECNAVIHANANDRPGVASMDQAQADARMSRLNFKAALGALEGGAA